MLDTFCSGAVMLASIVIALFFWDFYRRGRDRFFGFFALAFLLLGIERISIVFTPDRPHSLFYLVRLTAFLLIVFAVLDKNRSERKR